MKSQSHLTLNDRIIIQSGIQNGSTKAAIASTIGKDKSTIGKEIKLHRLLKHKSSLPLECSHYQKCPFGRSCSLDCPSFVPFHCKRRDRSPGACNGCSNYRHCRFNKFYYDAYSAHDDYLSTLVDSREGVNLTSREAQSIAEVIKPLIDQGQSPYQIISSHPELHICEKTLYNYIEKDVFSQFGISNISLRRKVSRRISKKSSTLYKKRQDNKYLIGRKFKDFENYMEENPLASVVQMDTVYNDVTHGPFIQTFKFLDYGLLFALYHESKTSLDMLNGIDLLEEILGHDLFFKVCEVILTDRGPEFVLADDMEIKNGLRRCRIFYCDPMQSGQKGSLENNHIELRYILPKQTNLKELGLRDQETLNIVLSHINSFPKESLKGKTPLEMTSFLNNELYYSLKQFGLKDIEKDKVILKPYLLKK